MSVAGLVGKIVSALTRRDHGAPRLVSFAVAAGACVAALLDLSSGAPAASNQPTVYVFPIPGGRVASPATQITFRGVSINQLGSIQVTGSRSGNHTGQVMPDSDGNGGSFIPSSKFLPGEVVTVSAPALDID